MEFGPLGHVGCSLDVGSGIGSAARAQKRLTCRMFGVHRKDLQSCRRCPGGSRAFLAAPFLIYGFWGLAGRVCANLHIQRCRGFRNALDGLKLQDLKCRVKIEGQDCFICIFLHLKIQSPSPASYIIYGLV